MLRSCLRLFLLLGLVDTTDLMAQPFGVPLSPEQVACEARQLARVLHRMSSGNGNSAFFLWRSGVGGGGYRGLLSSNEQHTDPRTGGPLRGEHQLTFDLLLRADQDFLNPRRPRLPQATLVRRDAASNLSSATRFDDVVIDLAPEVPDPTWPRQPLRITSRPDEGHDDAAGRGLALAGLLAPCHDQVTGFDLEIFEILARTVRFSACYAEPPHFPFCGLERYKTAVYRGAEPLTYRMDVFTYTATCDLEGHCGFGEGRTSMLFRFQTDLHGSRLTGGDVEALPWCTAAGQLDCTEFDPGLGFFVLPPIRPGIEVQGEATFSRAAHLNIDSQLSDVNILHATVNWADLLRDTSWNGGLRP